jgi:hypothetical protein
MGSIPLPDLYKIAVDEYRFEVKLNADRMIQYLTLSAVVLSAGVGLLRVGPPGRSTTLFVAIIFFCGICIALWVPTQCGGDMNIIGVLSIKRR